MNFRMDFSVSSKSDVGILVGIALNVRIALGSIVILTILAFNLRAQDFCIDLGFNFGNVLLFSVYQSFALLLNLFLSILHFHIIVNGIFSSSLFGCPLLVYRNATEFCVSHLG